MTKVSDIRNAHLEFMQTRGFTPVEPEPLISDAYPLMFTPSGGPKFVKNHLEHKDIPSSVCTVQPCFRLDHRLVGDGKHLSLFEMGMAASFDSIPRIEAVSASIEFLKSEHCKLDPEKFLITYFGGGDVEGTEFSADAETYENFRSHGFRETQFRKCGREESFEALKSQSFAGPRVEIFYNDRYSDPIEFWTCVQYTHRVNYDRENQIFNFTPLENHTYAIGWGIERLAQITDMLAETNDVDSLSPIIDDFKRLARKPDRKNAVVAADHFRGLAFLVREDVHKLSGNHNRSRKYLFRQYARNARKVILPFLWYGERGHISHLLHTLAESHGDYYDFGKDDELKELIVGKLYEVLKGEKD